MGCHRAIQKTNSKTKNKLKQETNKQTTPTRYKKKNRAAADQLISS